MGKAVYAGNTAYEQRQGSGALSAPHRCLRSALLLMAIPSLVAYKLFIYLLPPKTLFFVISVELPLIFAHLLCHAHA